MSSPERGHGGRIADELVDRPHAVPVDAAQKDLRHVEPAAVGALTTDANEDRNAAVAVRHDGLRHSVQRAARELRGLAEERRDPLATAVDAA
jgi:hypothetical protein